MDIIYVAFLGYLLGSISPSALISKLKKKNIREHGTGNLGALNTLINFGKKAGIFVMLFDIAKAVISVNLAKYLFPSLIYSGYIAGGAAVIGHMFPFYMRFKGGKGLAPFAGFVLANDPMCFLFLLIFGVTLMLIVNYSVALPFSVAVLYPFMAAYHAQSAAILGLTLIVSVLLIVKFHGNFLKALRGEDTKVRDFIRIQFSK